MSAQDDDVQAYALGAVFGVVALVVAGVVALAGVTLQHKPGPASAAAASAKSVYFEPGQDSLSAEASELLARVAETARDNGETLVRISGFLDATGDTALAQRRVLRVRHALEANGVVPNQVTLGTPGGGASGVEISLQPRH